MTFKKLHSWEPKSHTRNHKHKWHPWEPESTVTASSWEPKSHLKVPNFHLWELKSHKQGPHRSVITNNNAHLGAKTDDRSA